MEVSQERLSNPGPSSYNPQVMTIHLKQSPRVKFNKSRYEVKEPLTPGPGFYNV
jgi:hypothetical protein